MQPLRAESLGHRLPPGQGLRRHGRARAGAAPRTASTPAVMAVEVISDELVARGVDVAAQVTADAARQVLAAQRAPGPPPVVRWPETATPACGRAGG